MNGDTYEGDYKDGNWKGRGVFRSANGTVYEGGFLENKMHGLGWVKFANGISFYGEFSNNKRNGFGIQFSKDGSKKDGDVHVGQYLDGKEHGSGIFTTAVRVEQVRNEDEALTQLKPAY